MEKSKQEIIEFWKSHLCDMIPHDSPNYEEKLQEAAEEICNDFRKAMEE